MNRIISIALLSILVFFGFKRCSPNTRHRSIQTNSTEAIPESVGTKPEKFSCTGKTKCNEMSSCEEAMFYLKNCPNVEIDGDGDGVPCEQQFCGN
jgi:hypothetical protein